MQGNLEVETDGPGEATIILAGGPPLGTAFAVEFPGARSFVVFEGPVLCTKLRGAVSRSLCVRDLALPIILCIGTHGDYDKIDLKTVKYGH